MSDSRKSPSTILSDIKKNARRIKRENRHIKQSEALDISARQAGPYHDFQHAQKELSRAIAAMGKTAEATEPAYLSDLDYDIQGFKRPSDPTWTVIVGEDVFEMNERAGAPNGVCLYLGDADDFGDFSQYGIAVPYRDLPEGVRQGVRNKVVEGTLRDKLLRAEANAEHPQRLNYPPICAGIYWPAVDEDGEPSPDYAFKLPGHIQCADYYDRGRLGRRCTYREMASCCLNNDWPEEWAPMLLFMLAVADWTVRAETGKALKRSLVEAGGALNIEAMQAHLADPWLRSILREYGILEADFGKEGESAAGDGAFQEPLNDEAFLADVRHKLQTDDLDEVPVPRRGLNGEGAEALALEVARHAKTWGDLAALNFYRQVSAYGTMGTGGVAEEVCAWVDDIEKKRLARDWTGLFHELNGFREAAESYVAFFGMGCKELDELMERAEPLPKDLRLRLDGEGLIDLSEAPLD